MALDILDHLGLGNRHRVGDRPRWHHRPATPGFTDFTAVTPVQLAGMPALVLGGRTRRVCPPSRRCCLFGAVVLTVPLEFARLVVGDDHRLFLHQGFAGVRDRLSYTKTRLRQDFRERSASLTSSATAQARGDLSAPALSRKSCQSPKPGHRV